MYDSIRPYNIAERRRIQKASALYETHLENILDLLSARGISEETARYHHLGYIDNDPIPGHEDYNSASPSHTCTPFGAAQPKYEKCVSAAHSRTTAKPTTTPNT